MHALRSADLQVVVRMIDTTVQLWGVWARVSTPLQRRVIGTERIGGALNAVHSEQ